MLQFHDFEINECKIELNIVFGFWERHGAKKVAIAEPLLKTIDSGF